MLQTITNYAADFLSLIYPKTCAACARRLYKPEKELCFSCVETLPYTHFHLYKENALYLQLVGRIALESAAAYCFFQKQGAVQQLLHAFKYQGRPNIGSLLGRIYGKKLKNSVFFNGVDLIIPVPLHASKLRKRGYNQSEYFAQGLAESMQKPLETKSVISRKPSSSQTHKNKQQRFESRKNLFKVIQPQILTGKHLLVVDDVLTTGATLASLGESLLTAGNIRLSFITLAFTDSL